MNGQFNKSALSILLKRALGNRTQKSFVEDIHLSKEHFSRLVNQKRDTPPTIDTLYKIALNSQNRVSVHELLSVCGYNSNTIIVSPSINCMVESIMLALTTSPYTFSEPSFDMTDFYQMKFQFSDGPIHHWYFHFLLDSTFLTADHNLATNFLNLISKKVESNGKVSFVTFDSFIVSVLYGTSPHNLDLNFSLILINKLTLAISKENIL